MNSKYIDKNRDYSLDIFKTMLVVGMLWAHSWQFMHCSASRLESLMSICVNIISFSGFMFAFGRASQLAYLSKPREKVRHNLIINFITLLVVYYLSGFGYHFLVEEHQSLSSCIKILLLWKVPGYSEFLLSFAFLMIFILVFFETIIRIASSRKLLITAILFSLACSFLPYQYIKIPLIGVFLGCQEFCCFPLIQYSMFYFLGVYLQKSGMEIKWYYIIISIIISMIGISYTIIEHKLGNRFPPSIFWLVLSWFPIMCYILISNKIHYIMGGGVNCFSSR